MRGQNETVRVHYAWLWRRTLRRQNERVGTYYTRDTTSAKGDGRDALRTGVAEDTDLYSASNWYTIMSYCVGGLGLLPP